MDIFDKFFVKFGYKFPKGYPDMMDSQDVLLLELLIKSLDVNINEVSLSPTQIEKPYPPRSEFRDLYKDRGERFLEKIQNGDQFELNDGSIVKIDIDRSKQAIDYLTNKKYKELGGTKKLFVTTDGKSYSLSQFKKTKEFGSGSGFGGGAENTAVQESAQSVVNTIAYNIKKSPIDIKDLTEENITKAFKLSKVNMPLEDITKFILGKKDWTSSFINTANILLDTYSNSNFQQHRGSSFVDSIYEAFDKAKKKEGLSLQADKWNPADIWMVDSSILGIEFPTDFGELNAKLTELFLDKKLIGVSLKKIEGSGKLKVVNLEKSSESSYTYEGFESKPTNNNAVLKYNDGEITLRTFNFATNFAGEIKGKKAAHGKIGQGAISDIFKTNGLEVLPKPTEIQAKIKEKDKAFIKDFYVIYNAIVENINQKDFVELFNSKDLNWLVSKYLALKTIYTINNQPIDTQNNIISDIIRYASSSTSVSSVFVKVS